MVGGGPAAAQHPDILVLTYGPRTKEDEKKRDDGKPYELARSIRIGQIRDIQRRLNTRPTLGERRAVIIDPADDLEPPAANALLKSLEEPPAGTYFHACEPQPGQAAADDPLALPHPAISLRSATTNSTGFSPTTPAIPSADERAAAVAAASGSPGAALAFVEMGLAKVARCMRTYPRQRRCGFHRARRADRADRQPSRARAPARYPRPRPGHRARWTSRRLPARLATRRIAAHEGLVRLTGEYLTYNYDTGLFALEIGNLLAGCAAASERADV